MCVELGQQWSDTPPGRGSQWISIEVSHWASRWTTMYYTKGNTTHVPNESSSWDSHRPPTRFWSHIVPRRPLPHPLGRPRKRKPWAGESKRKRLRRRSLQQGERSRRSTAARTHGGGLKRGRVCWIKIDFRLTWNSRFHFFCN